MNKPYRRFAFIAGLAAFGAFLWSYWPAFVALQALWEREPDYSHGYLVGPIALAILWARKDKLGDMAIAPGYLGLLLVILSFGIRYLGQISYTDPLEHLSMLMWIAGVAWAIAGGRFLLWALPGIFFLVFMFPMPYRLETLLSVPMQRFATDASCWLLQTLGMPAFAIGTTITVNEVKIDVVEECSGLRMMISFLALCSAFALFTQRIWWEKILIVLCSLPISIACNVLRITATGVLLQFHNTPWFRGAVHDYGGIAMMPVALLMLVVFLWFLDRIFVETEVVESTLRTPHARKLST